MKTYKACLICSLIIGFAIFVAGANLSGEDRPEHVRAENWIKISDTAGIVVGSASGDKIVGTLYIKKGRNGSKFPLRTLRVSLGRLEYV
jgi:hypothetical protein